MEAGLDRCGLDASDELQAPDEKPAESEIPAAGPNVPYQLPKKNKKYERIAFLLLFAFTFFFFIGIAAGGIYLMGRVLQHVSR
jgi:hypothetical protein